MPNSNHPARIVDYASKRQRAPCHPMMLIAAHVFICFAPLAISFCVIEYELNLKLTGIIGAMSSIVGGLITGIFAWKRCLKFAESEVRFLFKFVTMFVYAFSLFIWGLMGLFISIILSGALNA